MDYTILLKSSLFKGLNISDTEKLISVVSHSIRKFHSGSMIFQSGENVDSLIMVIKGTVKGEMVDYSGKVIKIEDIPAPGSLATAFLFGKTNQFPVNVIAVTDGELLLIDKPEFLKLLMSNDIILANFMDMISNRSQFLSEKIKFLNFRTIKIKLSQYILKLAVNNESEIVLDHTQNDLADYFGVARPSVTRAMSELEDEGFITVNAKKIVILDRQGLLNLTRN